MLFILFVKILTGFPQYEDMTSRKFSSFKRSSRIWLHADLICIRIVSVCRLLVGDFAGMNFTRRHAELDSASLIAQHHAVPNLQKD